MAKEFQTLIGTVFTVCAIAFLFGAGNAQANADELARVRNIYLKGTTGADFNAFNKAVSEANQQLIARLPRKRNMEQN